jgi:hypothetical protein
MGQPEESVELASALLVDPALMMGQAAQDFRIDSLGDNRYRVSARFTKTDAGDTTIVSQHGSERSLMEVSVEVTLGDPPTVDNAHVDFLLRGHEAVPGETLPPKASPPSGPALRPPVRGRT